MKKRNMRYLSTLTEQAKRREYKELTSYQTNTFGLAQKKDILFFGLPHGE